MSQIQYDASVPEYLRQPAVAEGADAFTGGIGGARGPHVTFRQGRFFLVGTDGVEQAVNLFDPQLGPYIDLIMVDASPTISKIYYEGTYVPGENTPPTCFSNDGKFPDASSPAVQAPSCAACPWNVWGSETTQTGKQAKACSDRKQLAVLNLYDLKGPLYALSLSPSNLKPFAEYASQLAGRGIPIRGMVTRIAANPAAQGAMLFQPAVAPNGVGLWFVPQPVAELIATARQSQECRKAIGADANPATLALAPPPPQQQIAYQPPAHVPPGTYQPLTAEGAAMLNRPAPLPVQPVAATPTTFAPTQTAPMNGASLSEAPAGGRKRRTKAEMEAARAAQQNPPQQPPVQAQPPAQAVAQPLVAAPPVDPFAVASPGATAPVGVVQPAAPPYTPPPTQQPIDPFNMATAGSTMPPIPEFLQRQQPAAQFGVVTQPAASPPELDAMLAGVMKQ